MVADLDGVELEVLLFAVEKAVGEGGETVRQGAEGGGSAADGVALKNSAAEEHGDDDEGDDILAGCDAGEDGDAGDEIGGPIAGDELAGDAPEGGGGGEER